MSYHLQILQKRGFLHAIVTGRNSRAAVAGYLRDILTECKARDCFNVLIEERLEGPRLTTMDVFGVASEESARAFGMMQAIAYVDVNAEGDLMQFAEDVAVNRSVPVKVFGSVPEAENWLSTRSGLATNRQIADSSGEDAAV